MAAKVLRAFQESEEKEDHQVTAARQGNVHVLHRTHRSPVGLVDANPAAHRAAPIDVTAVVSVSGSIPVHTGTMIRNNS